MAWQAIIWTNDGAAHRSTYVLLGINVLYLIKSHWKVVYNRVLPESSVTLEDRGTILLAACMRTELVKPREYLDNTYDIIISLRNIW